MTDHNTRHTPSPEFRASLERDVMQAFRRQSQFDAPPSLTRRNRLRTMATLLIGLTIGAGAAVATAQVQESKVRDSLALAIDAKRKLAMLRLELAEAELESVLKSVKAGARSEQDAAKARLAVAGAELELKRVSLDEQETKVGGAAVRDELWAPKQNGRDFVEERLRIDAAEVQQQLDLTEGVLTDLRTRLRVGAIQAIDTLEASGIRMRTLADLQLLATKLQLRQSFLESRLNEQQVSARLAFMETQLTLAKLRTKLMEARERSKRANEQLNAGVIMVLDAKRAELAELELADQVSRM
ncbi:MAG: hypothetical protein ABI852_18070, partial [Gemmatimonadaceae bacterium]